MPVNFIKKLGITFSMPFSTSPNPSTSWDPLLSFKTIYWDHHANSWQEELGDPSSLHQVDNNEDLWNYLQ